MTLSPAEVRPARSVLNVGVIFVYTFCVTAGVSLAASKKPCGVPTVTQNVYTKITPTFSTDLAGLISAGDSVTVSAGADGDYYMSVVFTNQNAATDDFALQIRKNNTSIHSVRFTGAGASAFVAVSTMHYEELVAGDDLSLYITNTANGNDPVITEIDWFIYRVHE